MVAPKDPATVLFGRTRQAILSLTFTRPDESFYLREIVRRTGQGVGAVQRELAELTGSGILKRQRERFFQANPDSPLFEPLKQIVVRTMGVADRLRTALAPVARTIAAAFVFGSFASRQQHAASDVDVLVISKDDGLSLKTLSPLLRQEQTRLGREINPFVLTSRELREKLRAKNHFVCSVLATEKVFLIGDEHELGRLANQRLGQAPPDKSPGNHRPARRRHARPQRRKGKGT